MEKASLLNLSSPSLKRSAKEMESDGDDEDTSNSDTKTDQTTSTIKEDKNMLFLDNNDLNTIKEDIKKEKNDTFQTNASSHETNGKQKQEISKQNDFKRDVSDDSKSKIPIKRANKRKIGTTNMEEKVVLPTVPFPSLSTTRKMRYHSTTKFQAKRFENLRKETTLSESSTKEQAKPESNNAQTNNENKVDRSIKDRTVNDDRTSDPIKNYVDLNTSYTVVHPCNTSASNTSSEDVSISYCLDRPGFQPCCSNLIRNTPTAYSKYVTSTNAEYENWNCTDKKTNSLSTDKSTDNRKLNIKVNRPKLSIMKTETKYGKNNSTETNYTKPDSNEESDYTCYESISSFSVKSVTFMETTSTFRASQIEIDKLNEREQDERRKFQTSVPRKKPAEPRTDDYKDKYSKSNIDKITTQLVKPAVPYRKSVTTQGSKIPLPKNIRKSNFTPLPRLKSYKDILNERTKLNTKEHNEKIICDKEKSCKEKNDNGETSDENVSVDINLPVGKVYKISAQNLFTVVISDTKNKKNHKQKKDYESKREISDQELETTGMSSSDETSNMSDIITRTKGKIREVVPGPSKYNRKQFRDHQIMLYNEALKKAVSDDNRTIVVADANNSNIPKKKLYKKKNDDFSINNYIRKNVPTNLKDQSTLSKGNIKSNIYDKDSKQTNKNSSYSSICYKVSSNERPPWNKITNYQQLNTDDEKSLKSSERHEMRKRLKKLQSQNSKKRERSNKTDKNSEKYGLSNNKNNSARGEILFCTNNKNLISNLVTNEVSTEQSQTLLVYSDGVKKTSQDDVCYRGLRYLNTRTSDAINISGMKPNKKKGCFQWVKRIII